MADAETRKRLYDEYLALDDQYRQLANRLRPFVMTAENAGDHHRLVEIGERLEAKLHELQETSRVRRKTPRPDSGF